MTDRYTPRPHHRPVLPDSTLLDQTDGRCIGSDVRRGCPYEAPAMPPTERVTSSGAVLRAVPHLCATCFEWKHHIEPRISRLESHIAELRAERERAEWLSRPAVATAKPRRSLVRWIRSLIGWRSSRQIARGA